MHIYKEEAEKVQHRSGLNIINISSDDNKTFMTIKLDWPFTLGNTFFYSTLFQCYYEYDIMVPGWDFSFCFLGLSIYIRHNKDEALRLFEQWTEDIKNADVTTDFKTMDDFLKEHSDE